MQARKGNYIETLTGKKFYPLDPRPEDFSLDDMCHAVSREQRFNNHTEAHYSVGQHLLMCAKVASDLGLGPYAQFIFATHDLTEAYVRDLPSPLKKSFRYYSEVENRILHVLWCKYFGVREPSKTELNFLKYYDEIVCMTEAYELGINKTDWVNTAGLIYGYVDHSEPTEREIRDSLKALITGLLEELKEGDPNAS